MTRSESRRDHKAHKRARRLLDEAWDAVDDGDLQLADKLARRAIGECDSYALAHCEHGEIMLRDGRLADADRALRRALALDPRCVDALSALARLYEREDKPAKALAFARRASEAAPRDRELAREVTRLEASLPAQRAADELERAVSARASPPAPRSERVAAIDWAKLAPKFVESGVLHLRAVLTDDEIDACASAPISWHRSTDGVEERALLELPAAIAALLGEFYPAIADCAELRERSLGKADAEAAEHSAQRWPMTLADLQAACERLGQERCAATELRLAPKSSWAAPPSEAAGIEFPFACALGIGEVGSEFCLEDRRPGKRVRSKSWTLARGRPARSCRARSAPSRRWDLGPATGPDRVSPRRLRRFWRKRRASPALRRRLSEISASAIDASS